MLSQWNEADAPTDLLALRAYSSRLLGREASLVLHGGGNTSVKLAMRDFFGDPVEVLAVKGSGWDLASIEPAGFAPVRLSVLRRMAELTHLSDSDMVREQRAAMLDPAAPNPSVEAILHAVLPQRFVDHTHADAVVTLSNSPGGAEKVRALYGDRVIVVPYVMPGFVLARRIYELTRDIEDWSRIDGMVLLHHGVFTFHDDARESYERMIRLVTMAEDALRERGALDAVVARAEAGSDVDLLELAALRREVSRVTGRAVVARLDDSSEARGFASRGDAEELSTRGPVTPDHVIRMKRAPAFIASEGDAARYADEYRAYFARNAPAEGSLKMLDPGPRWAIWKDRGVVSFGASVKSAEEVSDIARHSVRCFQWGEGLGGWRPLGEAELFEMEYWELEQRKLAKPGGSPLLSGKIALVTGGATGIGRATAQALRAAGAAVCVLDIKPEVESFRGSDALGLVCDVTDPKAVEAAVRRCARTFGGLDALISNAGNFPPSMRVADIDEAVWQRTLELNVTSHMHALRSAAPFLERGVDPAVVVIASRNVPAPGPGAAAYSASKAALTQLARVAALELGPKGVRVNVLHPDKVFDTELWTDETIALRAKNYGLSVEAYKKSNLLGVEVMTADVAGLAVAMVGPLFRTTTGAQVPVDGGSDRVI